MDSQGLHSVLNADGQRKESRSSGDAQTQTGRNGQLRPGWRDARDAALCGGQPAKAEGPGTLSPECQQL